MPLDKRNFLGGLNSDDEDRYVPNGDYRFSINIHSGTSEGANVGSIENVKGNSLVQVSLPQGINKVIGSYEYKTTQKVYYFLYNKNTSPLIDPNDPFGKNHHTIFEYDIVKNTIEPVLINNILDFDPEFLITGINVLDGTIFFTDDRSNPKAVNIEKGKQFVYAASNIWQFDDNKFETGSKLGFISTNPQVFKVGDTVKIEQNPGYTFPEYNSEFKITSIPSQYEIVTDGTFLGSTPAESGRATLINEGYSIPLLEEYITAIRKPPECQPEVSYDTDPSNQFNFLTNKLFQFQYRWIYFNYQKSSFSPISNLPFVSNDCSTDSNINNTINVAVGTGSSLVTKIEITARIGNIGDFFSIAVLDKKELGLSDNDIYSYKFYNEKTYNNVLLTEANKLFDFLPRKAKAQDIVDGNRITYANILENFNLPDVQIGLNKNYSSGSTSSTTPTFSISGKLRITNYFIDITNYNEYQPIWSIDNFNTIQWGGVGKPEFLEEAGSDYKQTLDPGIGGFVVYLAGTDYFATTKQIKGSPNDHGAPTQNGQGVYDASGSNFYTGFPCSQNNNKGKMRCNIQRQNTYSTFTIQNVPVGKYVMRVASHLITAADLNSSSRSYQKTSTNTYQVGGVVDTECILEVKNNGDVVINGNTYSAGSFIGDTLVADLTNPKTGGKSKAIAGYVTDKDIVSPPPTTAGYLADTRIELAVAAIDANYYNDIYGRKIADHNGFFFVTQNSPGGNYINVTDVVIGGVWSGASIYQYSDPPTPFTPVDTSSLGMCIIRNNSNNVRAFCRTKLTGVVKSATGVGVKDVNVVVSHGRVDVTDSEGNYDPWVYRNSGVTTRADYLFYNTYISSCVYSFSFQKEYFNINIVSTSDAPNLIPPYNGDYDANNDVVIRDNTALNSGDVIRSFKRGAEYQLGIVYYDEFNRSTSTILTQNSKLSVPFYTQEISAGNYSMGYPLVDWSIRTLPPDYATHYQWVRTKNTALNRYLQFMPKEVVYINNDGTTASPNVATQIKISINLTDYKIKYPDSVLSYDFVDSDGNLIPDRIRFISKGGTPYTQYFDYQIIKYENGFFYIYNNVQLGTLDTTVLFELYTPKLSSDQQIFYECSECFPIVTNSQGQKVHGQGYSTINFTAQEQKYWTATSSSPVPNPVAPKPVLLTKLTGTKNHNFVVGDVIWIDNPIYTYVVVEIVNPKSIIISLAWASPITSPVVVHADATGIFTTGDAYYRSRDIVTTSVNTSTPMAIDDVRVSDFYVSDYSDIGRPNRVDTNFHEIRRDTTIYYSDKFIPETNINGLNSFFDTAFETYDKTYGSIQKVFSYNHRLDVYQELKVGSVPISLTIMYDNAGNQVVGTSNNVLNKIQYYQENFGIGLNPESFANYGSSRYFIDVSRLAVLRLSNDGITEIDNYKMNNYFSNKCKELISSGVKFNVFGSYDTKFSEYILSFEANTGITAQTIAFNEKTNRWSSFYSYLPEYIGMAGNTIVSFKSGNLWLHNSNILYNNFYGIQYESEVHVISNPDPSKVKVCTAVSEETADAWEVYEASTPNGQITDIGYLDFDLKENIQYAPVYFATNTPNVNNPKYNGDPMRDTSFLFKFRNNKLTFTKLFAINFMVTASERSDK